MARVSTDSSNRSPTRKRAPKEATPLEKAAEKPSSRKSKTQVLSTTLEPVNTNEMIATAAYYLAERRQFAPGSELEDWLAAERQLRRSH